MCVSVKLRDQQVESNDSQTALFSTIDNFFGVNIQNKYRFD